MALEALGELLLDELGGDVARDVARMVHHGAQERNVVLYTADHIGVQSLAHGGDTLLAILSVGDQLGDQRIVVHADLAALRDAAVHAHALAHRLAVGVEAADRRQKVAQRVLSVDTRLGGPAARRRHVRLRDGERTVGCYLDHVSHQILASDQLRDRMFHLQACVHLQEVKVALRIDQHLDRARRVVVDSTCQRHSLLAHRTTSLLVDEGARCLLKNLLVATLDTALSLRKVENSAVLVGNHLDLDVTRIVNETLDQHAIITEAGGGFLLRKSKPPQSFFVVPSNAHSFSTATSGSFQHDRVADFVGDTKYLFVGFHLTDEAWNDVHASLLGQLLTLDLVTHRLHGWRGRTNKSDTLSLQTLDKVRVLTQETIAWVYSLSAGLTHSLHNVIDHQVTGIAGCWSDAHRLVGFAHMLRVCICLTVYGHGTNAHLACGSHHTASDLTTIGDQNLIKEWSLRLSRRCIGAHRGECIKDRTSTQ
mmetsp:Transcript_29336/g.73840  ORF Transcript_29336/g.73840 Transcript_29336/m.73840 type:complete len:479 (+) Transcript_29336:900-2336(+)